MIDEAIAHPWAVWVIVALVCGILEIFLSSFYFIFSSIAALVTALIALQWNWNFQFAGFSLALLLSFVFIRPRCLSKLYGSKGMPSRTEILLGKKGQVTEWIDPVSGKGRVIVEGQDWAAKSEKSILSGQSVLVEGADGIVLQVREI